MHKLPTIRLIDELQHTLPSREQSHSASMTLFPIRMNLIIQMIKPTALYQLSTSRDSSVLEWYSRGEINHQAKTIYAR